MGPSVQVDVSTKNRSLVKAATARRRLVVRVELLFWRRMIDAAVADAKRTKAGLATDGAILARYWIEEFRPPQSDRVEWERSFEAACSWLELDAASERKRLLQQIDGALLNAWREHVRTDTYQRRAAVLACAGIPTAVRRAFVLPLVGAEDYEAITGIDHPDPKIAVEQLARLDAA